MFRSMNSEGTSRPTRLEAVKENPTSSWTSLFTALSRPAWAFLHKYFPGSAWNSEGEKSKGDFGHTLVAGLDNVVPLGQSSAHFSVACVHYQHENSRLLTTSDSETLTWLTQDSLKELGIQTMDSKATLDVPVGCGYLSTARNYLGKGLLNVACTQKQVEQPCSGLWYPCVSRRPTEGWWHGFERSEGPPDSSLCQSERSETKYPHGEEHHSGGHCELDGPGSAVAVGKPIELLVYSSKVEWMGCENTRPSCYKGSADKRGLHTARLEFLPTLPSAHQQGVVGHQGETSAATTCSEVAVLTPDQDHGYSSLEEESAHIRQTNMNVSEKLEMDKFAASWADGHEQGGDGDKPQGKLRCELIVDAGDDDQHNEPSSEPSTVNTSFHVPSTSHCQNKAIAYIMGSPCSDESDSEDVSSHDSDEDDGFDSEVSSNFSDSDYHDDDDDDDDDDEEEENEEEEEDSESDAFDSESERLWNSLCHSRDPYNLCNFTAPIQTCQKPSATNVHPISSGVPAESDDFLVLSSSCSQEAPQSDEESSEEACSSMDEAESLKLWNSFSCTADPYSPLNFQAPIRTQEQTSVHCKKGRSRVPHIYGKEEAEERMDSGFSEETPVRLKKVTFVEEVEVFYASSDEERCGPWEELARDRCRFQRRVQEVEESISYCLSPTFRCLVFQRLHSSS